ncbi:MAG TPA: hypothetical protein VMF08_01390 [Candidatus Sulfotelmatobacter sp.]|nr:hypothetical protein [Candidatus Sulfotelmatobacter sp.]
MVKNDFYLKVLESAIFIKHECKATHRETVFVQETAPGNEMVWTGHVEVFDLAWHETATRCYAWIHISENEPAKIFALPRSQVIDSPRRAVRAAIFSDAQPVIPPPSISAKLLGGGTRVAKSTATASVEVLAMAQAMSNGTNRKAPVHP